ncbi:MAG: cell division protein FtsZ [Erythrobacter sp.]|jgi:cell division protein FtsZ|nr:cell division protein FtsZ [Erythrobacter sp.]
MSIKIEPAAIDDMRPRITVIGIGGAGGNAIANMIDAEIEGVEFIVANTDAQALSSSPAETRIQLGPEITGGLGAGARPEVGKAAAEETVAEIEKALEGVNMVFIAAGMGGGTGTGAAPVIAEAARRNGVLTVGVVTKPFLFEGTRRMRAAEAGINELQSHVDTLLVIPNQNLFLVAKPETTFKEAFELADEVLQQGVRSITDLMVMPGLINLDFADVRSVMSEMGKAMMGTGEGEGENRALEAAEQAIANPLLDGVSMQGAKGVIISIIGGEDMKLMEVDEAANHIRDLVDEDANIIWGSAFNPDLAGKLRVSVVATGIDQFTGSETLRSSNAQRPAPLPTERPAKRPVLELPPEEEDEGDVAMSASDSGSDPLFQPEPRSEFTSNISPPSAPAPSPFANSTGPRIPALQDYDAEGSGNSDDEDEDEDDETGLTDAFDLSGMQVGDEMGEEDDDVDEIVDPLAGLREPEEEDDLAPPADDNAFLNARSDSFGQADDDEDEDDTLDLGAHLASDKDGASSGFSRDADDGDDGDDALLSDADRLAAEDRPVEERFSVSGPLGNGEDENAQDDATDVPGETPHQRSGYSAGSTLFERMANLSRSSGSEKATEQVDDDDDDVDDETPALSIPRFLGRQNNQ